MNDDGSRTSNKCLFTLDLNSPKLFFSGNTDLRSFAVSIREDEGQRSVRMGPGQFSLGTKVT